MGTSPRAGAMTCTPTGRPSSPTLVNDVLTTTSASSTASAPVATREAVAQLTDADEVVVLSTPADFRAVGQYYRDFSQTSDEEVVALDHGDPQVEPHGHGFPITAGILDWQWAC